MNIDGKQDYVNISEDSSIEREDGLKVDSWHKNPKSYQHDNDDVDDFLGSDVRCEVDLTNLEETNPKSKRLYIETRRKLGVIEIVTIM